MAKLRWVFFTWRPWKDCVVCGMLSGLNSRGSSDCSAGRPVPFAAFGPCGLQTEIVFRVEGVSDMQGDALNRPPIFVRFFSGSSN